MCHVERAKGIKREHTDTGMISFAHNWSLWSVCFHMNYWRGYQWKQLPRYWPSVRGIHWSPVWSPHKGQWRGALVFSLMCVWTNGWANSLDAGDLRRNSTHYDVTVMGSLLVKMLSATKGIYSMWQETDSQANDMLTLIWFRVGCACFDLTLSKKQIL